GKPAAPTRVELDQTVLDVTDELDKDLRAAAETRAREAAHPRQHPVSLGEEQRRTQPAKTPRAEPAVARYVDGMTWLLSIKTKPATRKRTRAMMLIVCARTSAAVASRRSTR